MANLKSFLLELRLYLWSNLLLFLFYSKPLQLLALV